MTTSLPKQVKPLADVLAYENENVLYRFILHNDVNEEEALEIFTETKKWLWLSSVCMLIKKHTDQEAPTLFIDENFLILDHMWHNFLMFTKDYREFCNDYLGIFIDHNPIPKSDRMEYLKRHKENPEEVMNEYMESRKAMFGFIYDCLGEEVLIKWFDELAERYPKEKIRAMRKDPD